MLVRMMQLLFTPGYKNLVMKGRASTDEVIHTLPTVILRGAHQPSA